MYTCIQITFIDNRMLEELGTGEFGVVTHGKWTSSSNQQIEVAIKTLNTDASDKDRLRFLQEAAIMCQFDHQNVIKLHGVVTEAPIMIVLKYMSRGYLQNLLIKLRCVIVTYNIIPTKLAIVNLNTRLNYSETPLIRTPLIRMTNLTPKIKININGVN